MWCRLLKITAALIAALLLAVAAAWYMLGGRVLSVQTNSMRPVFTAGDAVLVTRVTKEDLHAGDIVSFRDATRPEIILSHRIVQISDRTLITKGDNTPQKDLPITADRIIGRAQFVAPGLGTFMNWLRTPYGLVLAIYIPLLLAVTCFTVAMMSYKKPKYTLRQEQGRHILDKA